MRNDPTRKGKGESITQFDRRKLNVARATYGREKAAVLRGMGLWSDAKGRSHPERTFLTQIITRSRVEDPYSWHDQYGPTSMAEHFGMRYSTMRKVIRVLREDGLLRVVTMEGTKRVYSLDPDTVEVFLSYGRWR